MVMLKVRNGVDRHGKKIFLVLSIIIGGAFLGIDMTGGCGMAGSAESTSIGTIFDKEVTAGEFMNHRRFMRLVIPNSARRGIIAYADDVIGMAALHEANRLGITVSREEMDAYYKVNFSDAQGNFDKKAWLDFEKEVLTANMISLAQYEDAIRKYLQIRRYADLVGYKTFVVPGEKQLLDKSYFEEYGVDVAWFDVKSALDTVSVADSELQLAYNTIKNRYLTAEKTLNDTESAMLKDTKTRTSQADVDAANKRSAAFTEARQAYQAVVAKTPMRPAEFSGLYIALPFARVTLPQNFKVTDADIEKYYKDNLHEFSDMMALDSAKAVKPLAEAKDQIAQTLLKREQVRCAKAELNTVLQNPELDELRNMPLKEQGERFTRAAETAGFQLKSFGPLSVASPGSDSVLNLAVAQALEKNAQSNPLTFPVEGNGAMIVAFRQSMTPSTVQTFDEMKPMLLQRLKNESAWKLTAEKAVAFRAAAQAALDSGLNLDTVAGATFNALPVFALNSDSQLKDPWFPQLIQNVLPVPEKQLSPLFRAQNGLGLAYVKSRKEVPAPAAQQQQFVRELQMQKDAMTDVERLFHLATSVRTNKNYEQIMEQER